MISKVLEFILAFILAMGMFALYCLAWVVLIYCAFSGLSPLHHSPMKDSMFAWLLPAGLYVAVLTGMAQRR